MLNSARQWLHPREFRIPGSTWPPELLPALENLAKAPPATDPAGDKQRKRLLAEVGTGLWRLRQKLVDPSTSQPREEIRKAYRHFEGVWDALVADGLKIIDHTGKPYDSGLSLNPVAFQPMPGLRRPRIIETVKPTIYYREELLQIGDVVVGKPESGEPAQE